jgi:periplasmic protein TonB
MQLLLASAPERRGRFALTWTVSVALHALGALAFAGYTLLRIEKLPLPKQSVEAEIVFRPPPPTKPPPPAPVPAQAPTRSRGPAREVRRAGPAQVAVREEPVVAPPPARTSVPAPVALVTIAMDGELSAIAAGPAGGVVGHGGGGGAGASTGRARTATGAGRDGGGGGRGPVQSWPEPLNDKALRPEYPPAARAARRDGVVVILLDIDDQGRVTRAAVRRSAGHGFDEAALAYVRRLRFRPARAGGLAVTSTIEWTVQFHAEE